MRRIIITILTFLTFLSKAQPVPDCARSDVKKRLFVKSIENLICNLRVGNIRCCSNLDSTVNCFTIAYSDIKDSMSNIYFDFKIYKTIEDYDLDYNQKKTSSFMHIFIGGLNLKDFVNHYYKDTFNLYIEIPKFIAGIYYMDVSKNGMNKILVSCDICRESIVALNITPYNWKRKYKKNKNNLR
jgi:hypothetical protein